MDRLILALDVSGYPYAWLTWQEAVVHQCAGRVARQLGDFHFTFHGGRNRHTGLPSAITVSSIVALRGRNPLAWRFQTIALTNAALFHRDRQTCAYCGKHFSSSDLTRDHILPLALGGRDSWNNCTTACFRCNNRKGARTPEQAGMDLLYVPYAPSIHEGLILANRRILADQMEFLAALLPANSRLLAA